MKVALFATCLVDTLTPQVARATADAAGAARARGRRPARAELLRADARQHRLPPRGRADRRQPRARPSPGAEAIVAPSGSCVASIHHQQAAVARRAGEHALADEAAELAGRTYELSQFLVDVLGVTDVGAYYPHRVTYHPTCHSLRLLRVGDRPLRLLRAVRGLDLVELPGADQCCGFGGTFAVKNADTSTAMLADKMANVLSHARRGLHRRRRVLPDAHRRRAVPAALGHPHRAPGRDPRLDGGRRDPAPVHRRRRCPDDRRLPRHARPRPRGRRATCAATSPFPDAARDRAARRPAAAPTSATPPAPSAPSGPRSSARCPTGRSCARPAGRSRPPRWPASTST